MSTNNRWTAENIPDQGGRIAIVTGANSGIGYETARALAGKGATVILACRNEEKGKTAAHQILSEEPSGAAEFIALDLADLESVHRFAETYAGKHDRLDLLINNAGVMQIPQRRTTPQGFEMQFATNHLGHFALTGLLMDLILCAPASRVVMVSSSVHRGGTINFDDLQSQQSYSPTGAYMQSKLANLLFTYELARRLQAAGADTIAAASHPGWTATNLQQHSRLVQMFNPLVAQPPAMGTLPTLYAATSENVANGDYYGPGGFLEVRGYPKKVQSNGRSHDQAVAGRLWDVSEELTGVRLALPLGSPSASRSSAS